ncbi:redox-sensitive transcriptional activator SoxR [Shimia thalassica]|uniref:redox-sensitive transcriptional activator SoxR n=1 Tax=Shimia thalassica TaxID=1715693 RepID=UPI000C08765F|nr:redox-sensitive transcriptional activator SoxR [Shimia thalassica]PHO03848.1 redox-sensitive transcriptional activator SoxR [Rhodobacteraceae bacterium 4F10]MBU2941682.1 redox-sensitive transcriptional activator SoxR [Shimia thalassica]MDO6480646.1 redox-sensitive transcriptional activator SoxR [Shimia thalassica]MDO6483742.1 redox-sensitive transcriptional activator SoxR [Shimia thalassica]MDO6503937.1 redox-sensitive transcriptional activator SoxR [Shimia thalassica]
MPNNFLSKGGLTIGDVSERTGLAPSAIRFYEEKKLVFPLRNEGGQRRYDRSDIRRLSFVMIAQGLGFTLPEIQQALQNLPEGRTPTKRDWERISTRFRRDLDARIDQMQALRDKLDGCIGCGCLSLKTCKLYNPEDRARKRGAGPRYLMGDAPTGN